MSVSLLDPELTKDYNLNPRGYQQFLAASTTAAQSLTVPALAKRAYISAEAQAIRWRDDGVAPTAAVGNLIPVGITPFLYEGNLSAFQFDRLTQG